MIISASRKTDIPALYSDWFMDKVRSGKIKQKNPYNGAIYERSLNPNDVSMIVFWTRNSSIMMKKGYIDELIDRGFNFYFQNTITGNTIRSKSGEKLDGKTPNPNKGIEYFNQLADKIGGDKVIWRFDPIVVSDEINIEEIIRLYDKISKNISSNSKRNVISFLDVYQHVGENLNKSGFNNIINLTDPKHHEKLNTLLTEIKNISNRDGRKVYSCAETIDLNDYGIEHSKCIDNEYIKETFGLKVSKSKDMGQRKACGCVKSFDIGEYNTCVHGCVYCYANQEKEKALDNYKKHIPNADFILSNRII